MIQRWLDITGTWLGVACYPFCMFGSFVRAIIIMLLAATLGLIIDSAMGARIGFAGLLRMAAVGMTLSVYIDTALAFTDFQIPFWFFIATGITTLYVALGVWATGPLPVLIKDEEFDDDRDDDRDRRRRERSDRRHREDSSNTGYEAD